jgi:hypothetical protein
MKWDLDDTASDAVRFLLIGAGSLLLLRLGHRVLQHWYVAHPSDALSQATAAFHQGYLIGQPATVVVGGGGTGTRLAMAFLAGCASVLVPGGLVAWVVRLLGRSTAGIWRAARYLLLVSLGWWAFTALVHPPITVQFDQNGFTRSERVALLGELGLPISLSHEQVSWSAVDSLTIDGEGARLAANAGGRIIVLATASDGVPNKAIQQLAEALRVLHRPG